MHYILFFSAFFKRNKLTLKRITPDMMRSSSALPQAIRLTWLGKMTSTQEKHRTDLTARATRSAQGQTQLGVSVKRIAAIERANKTDFKNSLLFQARHKSATNSQLSAHWPAVPTNPDKSRNPLSMLLKSPCEKICMYVYIIYILDYLVWEITDWSEWCLTDLH